MKYLARKAGSWEGKGGEAKLDDMRQFEQRQPGPLTTPLDGLNSPVTLGVHPSA